MRVWMLGVLVAAGCSGGTTTGDPGPQVPPLSMEIAGQVCGEQRTGSVWWMVVPMRNTGADEVTFRLRAQSRDGTYQESGAQRAAAPMSAVSGEREWQNSEGCMHIRAQELSGNAWRTVAEIADGGCVSPQDMPACDGGP
jgi:hypothetical protein